MAGYVGIIIGSIGLVIIGVIFWYTMKILNEADSASKFFGDNDEDDFWF